MRTHAWEYSTNSPEKYYEKKNGEPCKRKKNQIKCKNTAKGIQKPNGEEHSQKAWKNI